MFFACHCIRRIPQTRRRSSKNIAWNVTTNNRKAEAWTYRPSGYDRQLRGSGGRRTLRRLSRSEFENTLQDLLDVPWLEVKELLPDDGRFEGFTKSAEALDVSPVLLSKYTEAIEVALQAAVAKWAVPPEVQRSNRIFEAQRRFDSNSLSIVMIQPVPVATQHSIHPDSP